MTRQQRAALDALRHGRFVARDNIAAMLYTSPQGAATTAASLVTLGYVERKVIDGRVHWRLTLRGRDMAALNAMRSGGVR